VEEIRERNRKARERGRAGCSYASCPVSFSQPALLLSALPGTVLLPFCSCLPITAAECRYLHLASNNRRYSQIEPDKRGEAGRKPGSGTAASRPLSAPATAQGAGGKKCPVGHKNQHISPSL